MLFLACRTSKTSKQGQSTSSCGPQAAQNEQGLASLGLARVDLALLGLPGEQESLQLSRVNKQAFPPPRATLLRCPNHACRAVGPTIRAQRPGMKSYYFIFSRKPARYEEDGRRQHMASGYQCDSHSYDIFMRRALHTNRWKQGGHCFHAPSPSCLHHSPSATRQHHLPWVVVLVNSCHY